MQFLTEITDKSWWAYGQYFNWVQIVNATRSLEDFFGTFDDSVKAVVERTSNSYWLSDWCRANAIELTLAHANMLKAISYAHV